ncbi:hypothetical protein EBN03_03355 [Nocardia stercoris]|uniref:Uncharacterized protein n=1 Tax=Nocardia stercoris TaxID=2483361 RepID=A0A3M2LCS2_9NOCA|nr:hypothetical protein EBN03_03355 [Nocardia stercoris]
MAAGSVGSASRGRQAAGIGVVAMTATAVVAAVIGATRHQLHETRPVAAAPARVSSTAAAVTSTPDPAAELRAAAQRALDAARTGDPAALLPYLAPGCPDRPVSTMTADGVVTGETPPPAIASVTVHGRGGTVVVTAADGSTDPQSWTEVDGNWLLACPLGDPGTSAEVASSSPEPAPEATVPAQVDGCGDAQVTGDGADCR